MNYVCSLMCRSGFEMATRVRYFNTLLVVMKKQDEVEGCIGRFIVKNPLRKANVDGGVQQVRQLGGKFFGEGVRVARAEPFAAGRVPHVSERPRHRGTEPELSIGRLCVEDVGTEGSADMHGEYALTQVDIVIVRRRRHVR